jgi:hypothetical protein
MYFVCFNGPPYSGKDTFARMFAEHVDSLGITTPVIEVSLSSPLRRIAYMMVGRLYVPETYDEFKKETFPQFGGVTGRQLMIDVSERFLKLCYGQDIMVKMLLNELQEAGFPDSGVVLVRDSGFQCEVDPLIDAVGAENLYVARVVRDGCSFKGDSREWVYHDNAHVWYNGGTLERLRTKAPRLLNILVNDLGWKL